jgi:Stage II sporulation protein E (SpoIIE)
MTAQMVVFGQVKDGGNADNDWEDGAGYAPSPHRARCVALDGAADAYGAIRWVSQLVNSFVGRTPDGPERVDESQMGAWFARMQRAWDATMPGPSSGVSSIYARRRAEQGSFATMLACEIDGLHTDHPRWTAAALGDTVLFHVRCEQRLEHFPPLRVEDFGRRPHGVHTMPSRLERMRERLRVHSGGLRPGDRLYLATDAVAEWILRTDETGGADLWRALDALCHPDAFTRLVVDRRAAGELKNDDATLLRVEINSTPPHSLRFPR